MVGYEKEGYKLNSAEYAFAGAGAGVITRFFCQPFDVIKIKFQLQVEPVKKGRDSKYWSSLQAGRLIYKEEGIKGLWRGHNPGQLLSVIYGLAQFSSFEALTKLAVGTIGFDRSAQLDFVCGGFAGVIATVASFPFDVIRTRFIAQGNNQVYPNMMVGMRELVVKEGWSGMFKGLSPTLLQVAPHAGAQFFFYRVTSNQIKHVSWMRQDEHYLNVFGNLITGCIAGILAKSSVYPFDLMRKRLQLQGFQQARQGFGKNFTCTGLLDCFVHTYSKEGVQGLFKGLSPSIWKAGATTALHFTSYEEICRVIAKFHR